MSKSRRYALIAAVTVAVLVICSVAVVLLTDGKGSNGDGGVIASGAATTVKTTAGSVDNDYLVKEFLKLYRNPQDKILSDGSPSVWYTQKANSATSIYIINKTGSKTPVPNVQAGQQVPSIISGHEWWAFKSGSVTYVVPITRASSTSICFTLDNFLTTPNVYTSANTYALIEEDVTYSPRVINSVQYNGTTVSPYNFNATLDGAGHKITASEAYEMSLTINGGDAGSRLNKPYITWGTQGGGGYSDYHLNAHSMFIGNMGRGTLKNFTLDDGGNNIRIIQHNNTTASGSTTVVNTAYGALVGVAGVYNNNAPGGTDGDPNDPYDYSNSARSNINNVNLLLNGDHTMFTRNDSKNMASLIMGGAVGYNANCNIDNLTVTINGRISPYALRDGRPTLDFGSKPGTKYDILGGVCGISAYSGTFKKVIVAGSGNLFCDWYVTVKNAGKVTNDFGEAAGIVFGQIMKPTTAEGVIIDFPYKNIWFRNIGASSSIWDIIGLFVGRKGSVLNSTSYSLTYKDIYLTNNVFAGINDANLPANKYDAVGNGTSYTWEPGYMGKTYLDDGTVTDHHSAATSITMPIRFNTDEPDGTPFTVCSDDITSIGFSQDANYMIEIAANGNGIVWDATWNNKNGTVYNTATSGHSVYDPVYVQNTATGVKLKAYGQFSGTNSNGRNLVLNVSKGDSATYSFDSGSITKEYNGKAIDYPDLRVKMASNNSYNQDFQQIFNGSSGVMMHLPVDDQTVGAEGPKILDSSGNNVFSGVYNGKTYSWKGSMDANRNSIGHAYFANMYSSVQKYIPSSGLYTNVDDSDNATAESSRKKAKDAGKYKFNVTAAGAYIAMRIGTGSSTYYMLLTPDGDSSFEYVVSPKSLGINLETPDINYNGNSVNFQYAGDNPTARARYSLTGIFAGDDVKADPTKIGYYNSNGTSITQAVDAATYRLSVKGLVGTDASNYTIDAIQNFTVHPLNVQVSPGSIVIDYGNTVASQAEFTGYTYRITDRNGNAAEITALPSGVNMIFDAMIEEGKYLFGTGNTQYRGRLNAGSYPIYLRGITFNDESQRSNYVILNDMLDPSGSGASRGTLYVNKAALTLSQVTLPTGLVYGDSYGNPTYKITGLVYGDTIDAASEKWIYDIASNGIGYLSSPRAAGDHTVSLIDFSIGGVSVSSENGNYVYSDSAVRTNFNIAAKHINLNVDFDTDTVYRYKGSAWEFTTEIAANDVAYPTDDLKTPIVLQSYKDINHTQSADIENVGKYYLAASFSGSYEAVKSDGSRVQVSTDGSYIFDALLDTNGIEFDTVDIHKATIAFVGLSEKQTVVYNDEAQKFAFTRDNITALNDSDAETLYAMIRVEYNGAHEVDGVETAGTYNVTLSLEETANYESVYKEGLYFEIQKEDMTVVINGGKDFVKEYNANIVPAVTVTVTGNNSGVNVNTHELQANLVSTVFTDLSGVEVASAQAVGNYIMKVSYTGTVNRNPATASIRVTVNPKVLTFALYDSEGENIADSRKEVRTYNKAAYEADYSLLGVVAGESVVPTFVFKGEDGRALSSAPINANTKKSNGVYNSYTVEVTLPSTYSNYTMSKVTYSLTIERYVLSVDSLTRTSYALRNGGMYTHDDYIGWISESIRMYDADGTVFTTEQLDQIMQSHTTAGSYDGFMFELYGSSDHSTSITDIISQYDNYQGNLHLHILVNEAVLQLAMFTDGNYDVASDATVHVNAIDITILQMGIMITVDGEDGNKDITRVYDGGDFKIGFRLFTYNANTSYGASIDAGNGEIIHSNTEYKGIDTVISLQISVTGKIGKNTPFSESILLSPGTSDFANFFAQDGDDIVGLVGKAKPIHAGVYNINYVLNVSSMPQGGSVPSTWIMQTTTRLVINPVQVTPDGELADITIAYHHVIDNALLESSNSNDVSFISQHKGLMMQYSSDVLGIMPNVGEYIYNATLAIDPDYVGPAILLSDYDLHENEGKIIVEKLNVNVSVGNLEFVYGTDYNRLVSDLLTIEYTNEPEFCDGTDHGELISRFLSLMFNTDKVNPNVGLHEGMIEPKYSNPGTNINFVTVKKGDVTVTAKPLVITWGDRSGVYGTSDIALGSYTMDTTLVIGDRLSSASSAIVYNTGAEITDISSLSVGVYSYGYAKVVFVDQDGEDVSGNYNITNQNKGKYTVSPIQLRGSYVKSFEPSYTGSEITDIFTFKVSDSITIPNGEELVWQIKYYASKDDVTADGNTVTVAAVGDYWAMARLVSVNGGAGNVNNYALTDIGWSQFKVSKANLTLSSIDGYDSSFNATAVYSGSADNKLFGAGALHLTFNNGKPYDADVHGALTVTISAVWTKETGTKLSQVFDAGEYAITVAVTGADNFADATFTNITLTVNPAQIARDDIFNYVSVTTPADGYVYNALPQHPEVALKSGITGSISVRYYEVIILSLEERDDTVNAGDYTIRLTFDSRNYVYDDYAYLNNAVDTYWTYTINRSDKIAVNISTTEQYYNGNSQRPDDILITLLAGTDQAKTIRYPSSEVDATLYFYEKSSGGNGTSTIMYNNKYYTYKVANPPITSVVAKPGDYYVMLHINQINDGNFVNNIDAYYVINSGADLGVYTVKKGIMSVSATRNIEKQYDGVVGINGKDVIYEEGGNWYINDEIISIAGAYDYKFGTVTIDVSYFVENDGEKDIYTRLYRWTWYLSQRYDGDGNPVNGMLEQNKPVKHYYSSGELGIETQTGPYKNVFDFAFAGKYKIDIEIDNSQSAYYSQAREIVFDEDGNSSEQNVNHHASGGATITLNNSAFSIAEADRLTYYNDYSASNAPLKANPNHYFHGIAGEDSGDVIRIDGKDYKQFKDANGDGYEDMLTSDLTFEYFTDRACTIAIARNNIYNAGKYYIRVTYAGDEIRYNSSTWLIEYIIRPAEYWFELISDSTEEYETEFGTAFDLNKMSIGHDISPVEGRGKNTQFENNVRNLISVRNEGKSTYNGYATPVGKYTIFYGWTWSVASNNEIRNNVELIDLSSSDSKTSITVKPAQLVSGVNSTLDRDRLPAGKEFSAAVTSGAWEQEIRNSIEITMNYFDESGNVVAGGEKYNVSQYTFSYTWNRTGEGDYAVVDGIYSVGKYKITVNMTDPNISGCDFVIDFEVTKAIANVEIGETGSKVYDAKAWNVSYKITTPEGSIDRDITSEFGQGDIHVTYYKDGQIVSSVVDAGDYTIEIYVDETDDYARSDVASATFKVNKANVDISYNTGYVNNQEYIGKYNVDADNVATIMLNGEVYAADKANRYILYITCEDWGYNGSASATQIVREYAQEVAGGSSMYLTDWLDANHPEISYFKTDTGVYNVGSYYPVMLYLGDNNVDYSVDITAGTEIPEVVIYRRAISVNVTGGLSYWLTYGDERINPMDIQQAFNRADCTYYEVVGYVEGDAVPEVRWTVADLDNTYQAGSNAGEYTGAYYVQGELSDSAVNGNYYLEAVYEEIDLYVARQKFVLDSNAMSAYLASEGDSALSVQIIDGKATIDRVYSGNAYSNIALAYDGIYNKDGEGVITAGKDLYDKIIVPPAIATYSLTDVGSVTAMFTMELKDTVNYEFMNAAEFIDISVTLNVNKADVEVRLRDSLSFKDGEGYDAARNELTLQYVGKAFNFADYFEVRDVTNDVEVVNGFKNIIWSVDFGANAVPTLPGVYSGISLVVHSNNYDVKIGGVSANYVVNVAITKNHDVGGDLKISTWFDNNHDVDNATAFTKVYDTLEMRSRDFGFTAIYGEFGNAPSSDLITEVIDADGNAVSTIKNAGVYTVRFRIAASSNWCFDLDETKNYIEYKYVVARYDVTDSATLKAVDRGAGYDSSVTLGFATYNGKSQTPAIDIWASESRRLVANTDYTLDFGSDTVNAGTFDVTVTFVGNYTGSFVVHDFVIDAADLATAYRSGSLSVDYIKSYAYTGEPIELQGLTISFNGKVLTERTDYTYNNNTPHTKTGTHSVSVTGNNNFKGHLVDENGNYVINYYIGASVALPESAGAIVYGDNKTQELDLTVASLDPGAKLDGDLTVHINKVTAYTEQGKVSLIASEREFIWIVGHGSEARTLRFTSTSKLPVGTYRIEIEYDATLKGADTVKSSVSTSLSVTPSSNYNFRISASGIRSTRVDITLVEDMVRSYEYSVDGGATWSALSKDGIIEGLDDDKDYEIIVRINDANFASDINDSQLWKRISVKTTLAPSKVTAVADRLKTTFRASSLSEYIKMLSDVNRVAESEKTSEFNASVASATSSYEAYIAKLNSAVSSANSTANRMASKSISGADTAAAVGTALSVSTAAIAVAGVMIMGRRKRREGDKDVAVVRTAKARSHKLAIVLIAALCIAIAFTFALAGCKETYDSNTILSAASSAVLNGASPNISYTISDGSTVVYAYKDGKVTVGNNLQGVIGGVVPSFDGKLGFNFSADCFSENETTFEGSIGTYKGDIIDARGFWEGDNSASKYRNATIVAVADCATMRLQSMTIEYTFESFKIQLVAEYAW